MSFKHITTYCSRGPYGILKLEVQIMNEKSRLRETPNLLTNADSITNICFPLALTKGLIAIFFFFAPPPQGRRIDQ